MIHSSDHRRATRHGAIGVCNALILVDDVDTCWTIHKSSKMSIPVEPDNIHDLFVARLKESPHYIEFVPEPVIGMHRVGQYFETPVGGLEVVCGVENVAMMTLKMLRTMGESRMSGIEVVVGNGSKPWLRQVDISMWVGKGPVETETVTPDGPTHTVMTST